MIYPSVSAFIVDATTLKIFILFYINFAFLSDEASFDYSFEIVTVLYELVIREEINCFNFIVIWYKCRQIVH